MTIYDVFITRMNTVLTRGVSMVFNVEAYLEDLSMGHEFPGIVDFYLSNRILGSEEIRGAIDFLTFFGRNSFYNSRDLWLVTACAVVGTVVVGSLSCKSLFLSHL